MKKAITPLILLACAVLFSSGCANVGAIVVTGLRVEVTGIERKADGTVNVSWQLVNPNVTSYLMAQVANRISLNGTLIGTTLDRDPMGVPANGNAAKTSKLTVAGPAASQILTAAAGHEPVNYRVESNLIIQIYGESTEKGDLVHSGTVTVTTK